jgi:hypothetical protein
MRISNSFSEGEIQVLEFILQTLLRGGSPAMAVRHKEFASLYRKVMSMRKRVNHKRDDDRPVTSVGTIGAVDATTEVEADATVEADDVAAAG